MNLQQFLFWLFQKLVIPSFTAYLQKCGYTSYNFRHSSGQTVRVVIMPPKDGMANVCKVCGNVEWEHFPFTFNAIER